MLGRVAEAPEPVAHHVLHRPPADPLDGLHAGGTGRLDPLAVERVQQLAQEEGVAARALGRRAGGLKSRAGSSHLLAREVPARSVVTSIAGLSSRAAFARLPRPEPIRPSLDAVADRFHGGDQATGITIAAAPGQRVAAPVGGLGRGGPRRSRR